MTDRHQLVLEHRKYAERYALKIMRVAGVEDLLDDIISEAHLGLVEASIRFDPERGVRFGTFASFWIRKQVTDFIDDNRRSVRKTKAVDVKKIVAKISPSVRRLQHALGRFPTTEEIAADIGATVSAVVRAQAGFMARDIPVSTSGEYEDGARLLESTTPTPEELYADAEEQHAQAEAICAALAELEPRDAEILRRRFYADEPEKLVEVGDALGISRERVRQLQDRALPAFREALADHGEEWAA